VTRARAAEVQHCSAFISFRRGSGYAQGSESAGE
jgi:hypothetical protein